MDCIAHRGFAAVNPENTLPAVRAAAAAGADAVEVDVRRCGSGALVVCHDESLDRVSNATGAVADHELSALREVDVLGTGQGIPTLAETVDVATVRLNVELKQPETARDALAVADDAGADPLFSAFDPDALARLRGAGADRALLFATDPEANLDAARRLDCAAVHPHHGLCTPAFVAEATAAGFAVNAWTVRDADTAAALAAADVDGRIVDDPAFCV